MQENFAPYSLAVLKQHTNFELFGVAELKSLLEMSGIALKEALSLEVPAEHFPTHTHEIKAESFKEFPFVRLNLSIAQKEALRVQSTGRAVSLHCLVDVLAEGGSYDELLQNLPAQDSLPAGARELTMLFRVTALNVKLSHEEKLKRYARLMTHFNLENKVDLKTPQIVFRLIEAHDGAIKHQKNVDEGRWSSLRKVYFGIEAFRVHQGAEEHTHYGRYALRERIYLGPTSTDEQLAFFMANQAQVVEGSLVLDPFVGTGGLLIPPAHFGATCVGSDIDARVIHGLGVGKINTRSPFYRDNTALIETIKPKFLLNFLQYGLRQPEILRMDASEPAFRNTCAVFDAIICDPPYGIRATKRKTVGKGVGNSPQAVQQVQTGIVVVPEEQKAEEVVVQADSKSSTQTFKDENGNNVIKLEIAEVRYLVERLFDLAYRLLHVGGLLVYLYPINKEVRKGTIEDLPLDARFEIVDYSENLLLGPVNRYCVTMRKL